MALINCPECKTEVSEKALKCQKCGFQLRKPKRTIFGKIVKYCFIGFNILMLWWMVAGMSSASKVITKTGSQAEQAGAAIGTGIGAILIIGIWVAGDIILGLFTLLTRPKV